MTSTDREACVLDIRRILCPIDYSEASRRALEQAVMIAGWFEARVTALHVCPPTRGAASRVAQTAVTNVQLSCATAALTKAVNAVCTAGAVIDEVVLEDVDAESRILEYAASLPADMVVMGTHGRTGLNWLIIGSVTDRVLRSAQCPVLTVPPTAAATVTPPFKRLLCAVDFSPVSLVALALALRFSQEADAHLTVLHVISDPANHDAPARDTPARRRRAEEGVCLRLNALVPAAARIYCDPQPRVVWGPAYRRIVEVADDEASDLIVMGVSSRGVVDRMFVGSTTNQVVRHAACPVLTIRS